MVKNGIRAGSLERQISRQSRRTAPRTVRVTRNQNREILNGPGTQSGDEARGCQDCLCFLTPIVRVNQNLVLRRKSQKVCRRADAGRKCFA